MRDRTGPSWADLGAAFLAEWESGTPLDDGAWWDRLAALGESTLQEHPDHKTGTGQEVHDPTKKKGKATGAGTSGSLDERFGKVVGVGDVDDNAVREALDASERVLMGPLGPAGAKYLEDRGSPGMAKGPGIGEFDDDLMAEAVKHDVVDSLAREAGVTYKQANEFVAAWTHMQSNPERADVRNIHRAIEDELGCPRSDWQKSLKVPREPDGNSPRAKAIYDKWGPVAAESNARIVAALEALNATRREGGPDASRYRAAGEADAADKALRAQAQREIAAEYGIDASKAGVIVHGVFDVTGLPREQLVKHAAGILGDWIVKDDPPVPSHYRKLVRAMYDRTQRELASQGVDSLTLLRGTNSFKPTREQSKAHEEGFLPRVEVTGNSAESYTPDMGTAMKFGGSVIAVRVPRARVLSTCRTGVGCLNEREFVILDGSRTEASLYWTEYGEMED